MLSESGRVLYALDHLPLADQCILAGLCIALGALALLTGEGVMYLLNKYIGAARSRRRTCQSHDIDGPQSITQTPPESRG